jgi:hypothetical protein
MMSRTFRGGAIPFVALLGLTACAGRAAPDHTAAAVESSVCPRVTRDDLALAQSLVVIGAHPLYTRQPDKYGDEPRVSGVKLTVRPPEGATADMVGRALQCHSARALLGQVDRSVFPDDPYWLPDAWLDIRVAAEGTNDAVYLRASTVAENLRVLDRVSSYARAQGTVRSATP